MVCSTDKKLINGWDAIFEILAVKKHSTCWPLGSYDHFVFAFVIVVSTVISLHFVYMDFTFLSILKTTVLIHQQFDSFAFVKHVNDLSAGVGSNRIQERQGQ